MEDIKALFYFEIGHLAVHLLGRLTFRETAMKTSMDWPVLLLFVDTYEDYHEFMTPGMKVAAENIKNAMQAEHNLNYTQFRTRSNRYMNLFGTWGPDAWDYFGGMAATYWRKDNRCGLTDIVFGDRPTDAVLDLSCLEFFHFISNWMIAHDWWIVQNLNLDTLLNSDTDQPKIPEPKDKSRYGDYEIHLRDYLFHYLLDIHKKLLNDELSLEYLLSLNGIHLVGALLTSKRLRDKYGWFFRRLLDSKDKLPRGWKAVLAIILDHVFHPDYPDFHYFRLTELQNQNAESYEKWMKELECDEFQIFEEYDEYMNRQEMG